MDTIIRSVWIPLAESALELREGGNAEGILAALDKAAPYERAYLAVPWVRGRAYLMLDQPTDALAEFKKIVPSKNVSGK